LILSSQHDFVARLVEVVDGVHAHHVGSKDFLVTPRILQIAMAAIRLEEKPVPWVLGDFKQLVNRYIQFRDVKLGHFVFSF
jgi:hypothetical protein